MTDMLIQRQITDIADIIRVEGSRSFCVRDIEAGMSRAAFCGIETIHHNGALVTLRAHDLEIKIDGTAVDFVKGSMITLHAWHRHMSYYRRATAAIQASAKAAA